MSRPSPLRIAWLAVRAPTLPLSLSPVVAGAVVGGLESGAFRPDIALAAGLSAAAIQIGTNLHNDAVDAINGTDRADRVGPVRVTQRGWVEPKRMLNTARATFALAALFGIYLVILGGWPIAAIGLVSIAAAWGYSSGPWPISRGPFGELFVLVFFGLVAVATVAWLHTGAVTAPAILIGAVVGLPATLVLLINNARDIEGDVRAGRKTLAILLGRRGSIRLAGVFMAVIVFSLLLLAALGRPWYGALAGLIGLAPAIPIRRMLTERAGPEAYNASLRQAVRFQMVLTLAVCAGLVVAAWVG